MPLEVNVVGLDAKATIELEHVLTGRLEGQSLHLYNAAIERQR
jgi:hypothetical protein